MPKLPRLTAAEAEALLLKSAFVWLRSKGSHRIYKKGDRRVVVPFHGGETLHPKTVKESTGRHQRSFDRVDSSRLTP
jgi:predicted RNA binding protein YcfA (HicA-like mRNA interferase family)